MRSIINIFGAVCLLAAMFGCGANFSKKTASEETVKQFPRLSVVGTQLMNENGDTVVLRGVSYGWHQFWPRFYNDSTVAYFAKDWGAQVLRASMGVDLDSACYVYQPEFGIECVTKVVDAAIKNDVYAIIDWHSHNLRQKEAIEFFTQMATRYKGVPNVIYEIYNEPVEDSWEQLKSYSTEVIKAIRAIEPDAVILVGCPHWDQDIHLAADNPISGYDNIMYTLHFYANTHGQWLRDRANYALSKGLPVFVSECAGMEASGDGSVNPEEWQNWLDWMQKHAISWAAWSVSDKDETCSMLLPSASSGGNWKDEDLKEWGRIVRNELKRLS